jgi:hypothetical protein
MRRWTVVVEGPDGAGFERALDLDAYVIGRESTCTICLPVRDVSRRHAVLERDRDGFWHIADEGGRFGTFVNGVRIEKPTQLVTGDIVHVGDYRLELRSEGSTPKRHLLLPPPDQRNLPPPPRVRVYDGPLEDRDIRLDRGAVTFGVDVDATVPLDGKRFAGVRVVIRPRKEGGFEVVDQSAVPSLTVNGRPKSHATLGLDGEDVVLGLGPVERQRRDINDAFEVRYMTGERSRGQHTPPPRDTQPMAVPTGRDTLLEASADDTLRMQALASEEVQLAPEGAQLAPPASEPRSDAPDTSPAGPPASCDGAEEPALPHASVDDADAAASTSSANAVAVEVDAAVVDSSRRPLASSGQATEGWAAGVVGPLPASERLAASAAEPGLNVGHAAPEGAPPAATAPEPGVSQESEGGDNEAGAGPERSLGRLGVVLGAVVALCALLAFWLWPTQAPVIGAGGAAPGPIASDVRASVPGPTVPPPSPPPALTPAARASEAQPPPAPRRSADAPPTARVAPRPPPASPVKGPKTPAGDDAGTAASALQKKQCLLRGGVDCTPAEPSP